MWLDPQRVSDPPADVAIRVERGDDFVEFSGAHGFASADVAEQLREHPAFDVAERFMAFWKVGVGCMTVFGVFFILLALLFVLVLDAPMNFNGQPADPKTTVLFLVGFLIAWIAVGCVLYRGGRSMTSKMAVLSGKAPAWGWRLRVTSDEWILKRNRLGAEQTERWSFHDVQRLEVTPAGDLVAQVRDPNNLEDRSLLVAGLNNAAEAEWLKQTLVRLAGLRG